ncbi:hypothetical protein JCM3774_003518 [Rhodotorula dairenensis]
MASDPLRSRRLAAPATASTATSRTLPREPYADKPSSPAKQRKLSLSDDRNAAKAARSRPPAGLWSRVGGGLDVVQPGENRVLAGLVLLGAVVRYWHIARPSSVVFDEVHFGGFANKYIQSRFFMDVHPPLAKLLITLVAWLAGFKGGQFDFKDIGAEYGPAHVPYVAMRLLPATLGLALVPLAYLTLRALHLRPATALLGALLVLFENGLITQSRFILLDSPLILFTALAAFFWIGFSNENETPRDRAGTVGPFSRRWWAWLTLTGLALGAVVSCKWVGLFTIATVGVFTVAQLWLLLGDLRVPIPLLARHFVARAICLIAVPAVFYISMFAIHFAILSNSGDGDGFMSSEFQHTLRGHGMQDTFAEVMVGSRVTIRHAHTQGGYLHSHPHNYPGGSQQQQITLYPHRDDNNVWLVLNATADPNIPDAETHAPATPVKDRQTLVFHHPSTHKKLHSHDVRPPVSEVDYQNEVSGYGFEGFDGDANDHWVLEIDPVESAYGGRRARTHLEALRTRFRLRHLLTGCYLFSHKVKLPEWGFEQQEVTCNKNPSRENALWYVETNEHKMLPLDARRVNYRRPSFLAKFAELQAVMWQTNQGLTDRHAYDSRPSSWPLLLRGINFWVKDHRQVYLIGNPFAWALSTLAVSSFLAIRGLLILRAQRGYKDFANSQVVYYDRVGTFLFAGWFLHYFPFFLMGRQLFLHHYFPALYFALLLVATAFDLVTSRLRPRLRLSVALTLVGGAVLTWWYLSPLAYAGVWTRGQCERAKKLGRNWDFSCADFHEKKSDYAPQHATLPAKGLAADGGGGSKSATSIAAAVQPGRGGFEPVEKAPVSSSIPDEPPRAEAAVRDEDRDGPLFDEVQDGDRAAVAREMTTSVVANQPVEAPGLHPEDDGVAIPAAAEGTTALPIKAILQAEVAGGGKAAGPPAVRDAEDEEDVPPRRRDEPAQAARADEAAVLLEEKEEEEVSLTREEEDAADIDLTAEM